MQNLLGHNSLGSTQEVLTPNTVGLNRLLDTSPNADGPLPIRAETQNDTPFRKSKKLRTRIDGTESRSSSNSEVKGQDKSEGE